MFWMHSAGEENKNEIMKAIQEVAELYNAEIYVYSAPIDHRGFGQLVSCFNPGRPNALLILTTNGGIANSAYKISRFFQEQYEEFVVVIPSVCKSAGTLLACGASRLVMSQFSELGPLDVQLRARDEIFGSRSGLLNHSAFEALKREAFEFYEHFLLMIKARSGDTISYPLASDVAAKMTSQMMSHIFDQISPDALGSDFRDLQVAVEYGRRLAQIGENISRDGIEYLTNHYPSHDFIIDKSEAEALFEKVDAPEPPLWELIALLGDFVFSEHTEGAVFCVTNLTEQEGGENSDGETEEEAAAASVDSGSTTDRKGSGASSRERADGAGTSGKPARPKRPPPRKSAGE